VALRSDRPPGNFIGNPTAEATACQQALQAAIDYGISRIQVEVDSSVLQHALQSSTMDLATFGMMIRAGILVSCYESILYVVALFLF
jgi:hypothetical protein